MFYYRHNPRGDKKKQKREKQKRQVKHKQKLAAQKAQREKKIQRKINQYLDRVIDELRVIEGLAVANAFIGYASTTLLPAGLELAVENRDYDLFKLMVLFHPGVPVVLDQGKFFTQLEVMVIGQRFEDYTKQNQNYGSMLTITKITASHSTPEILLKRLTGVGFDIVTKGTLPAKWTNPMIKDRPLWTPFSLVRKLLGYTTDQELLDALYSN